MRKIHIYCDGGFGNRFNGLIAGLLIAKHARLDPIVVWPVNNWCGATYQNLLASPAQVLQSELASYVGEKEHFQFFMTEDHLNMGVHYLSPLVVGKLDQALEFLKSDDRDVFFHTPLIPHYLDGTSLHQEVEALEFQQSILARVHAFMQDKQLGDFFGIHIRKTDFGSNSSDDTGLFALVQSVPDKKFFVCSDDAEVEERFSTLPNVVLYPKRAYVEKLVDGNWNTATSDHSGRVYACNVNRSALSVEDAIVDLLLLSHSQIVSTSNSTFRNAALLIKAARHSTK